MFHFMIVIIYTISLGVNKEKAVKVYDTNLIYSRVVFPLHYSQIVKN